MVGPSRVRPLIVVFATFVLGISAGLGLAYRKNIQHWVRGQLAWGIAKGEPSEGNALPGQADHSQQPVSETSHPGMDHSQHQMESAATAPSGERKVLYWYDPMHPAYKSDKPGIAPDCGMKLVPRYADEVEAMKGMAAGTVMLTPEKQQLIGVRTTEVRRRRLDRTLRTSGRIEADETKIARIHVKIAGWVEKVYVDYEGKLVKKGQPLFTVYSPELVSTQQEYLIARRGETYLSESPYREAAEGAKTLLRASRDRLRLWDISDDQIQKLDETGQVSRTMTLYSPIDGFVMHRNLYEQTHITPEMQLYEIADLSTIWVYADIYEYEIPYVHLGQAATMKLSYFPERTYVGHISYVYPTVDPKTRTAKVRLEFPNPNFDLKPDMYADVQLKIDYGVQTLVPGEAVLDSGVRQMVFVAKPGGYFEPRQVKVGPRLDDQYVILSGLKSGETIVSSGNFLIDSESRLSSATGGMSH
jgi:Cu(I)/Ag(I) efflux system membrane fusion protein